MVTGIINDILTSIFNLILFPIVQGIYHCINWSFQIFLILGYTNLFGEGGLSEISKTIYVIIGLIVLFVVAYNILLLIIDPSKDKGFAVSGKLIRNIVISLGLIVLCPTIFSYASKFQTAILDSNAITKLVFSDFSDSSQTGSTQIIEGGRLLAAKVWESFYQPSEDFVSKHCSDMTASDAAEECRRLIKTDSDYTLLDADKEAEENGTFIQYLAFTFRILENDLDWSWLLSIAAGIFVLYIILSYCVEMAERVVKLVLYEFLAPLCISARIIPGKEKIFSNWLSAILKTYLSLFIKIFSISLSIYIINFLDGVNILSSTSATGALGGSIFFVKMFADLFMILGILLLMKNASKYIEELFGFKMAGNGLMSSLKDAGFFTAGAAVGGGVTSAITNFKNTDGSFWQKSRSAFGGFGSGAFNGFKNGKGAGDFKAMGSSITKSRDTAYQNKLNRASRLQRYSNSGMNWFQGRMSDTKESFKDYFGGGLEKFNNIIETGNRYEKLQDNLDASSKKMLDKYSNNVVYRGSDDGVKGLDNSIENLRTQYKGLSLSAIRKSIDAENSTPYDASKYVDKSKYTTMKMDENGVMNEVFDNVAYNNALSQAERMHYQEMADKESYYNQVYKASYKSLEDSIINSKRIVDNDGKVSYEATLNGEKYTFSENDVAPIITNAEEIRNAYIQEGNSWDKGFNSKTIGDVVDTAKIKRDDAKKESMNLRQNSERRKEGK